MNGLSRTVSTALLICLCFLPVQLSIPYTVIDGEEGLKVHMPSLINMTYHVLKEQQGIPDVTDDERWMQHLALVNNLWKTLEVNMSSDTVQHVKFYPENNTIFIHMEHPFKYEISSSYLYNFAIFPAKGSAKIKGEAVEMKIWMKFHGLPPGEFCVPKDNSIVMDPIEVTTSFIMESIEVKTENYIGHILAWIFGINSFIEQVFESHTEILAPSLRSATFNSTRKYFRGYAASHSWDYSHGAEHKWFTVNTFCKLQMEPHGAIKVVYNQSELIVPKQSTFDSNIVREHCFSKNLLEDPLDEVFSDSFMKIQDSDLPANMKDRLDFVTFQKFVPDLGIRYKDTESNITLTLEPKNDLFLFLEKPKIKYALATYSFQFQCEEKPIIWGTAQVMIEFVAEWTRQPSRKVGFLNLRGKRIEVLSESIQVKSSFLLSERFNTFIDEIMDYVIRPRFEAAPLFFDKGIPVQDTPANYTSTEVYWGEDFDVVILSHRKFQQ